MPDSAELTRRLDLARHAALVAEREILPHYQSQTLAVERKGDTSPVTIADRNAEAAIRKLIEQSFPDDAILGEEFGERAGTSGYRWILDPLDGTKSFVHGVPLFGTLIGIEHSGTAVVGVCHIPVLQETAWAAVGQGAWWTQRGSAPRPARVTQQSNPAEACLCFTTIDGFHRIGRFDAFTRLVEGVRLSRGWGDCYGHFLVATGRADIMVDPLMNPWDAAALVPIVQEAGGVFMDWTGKVAFDSGNGISVNAALRDHVLAITGDEAPGRATSPVP